MFSSHSDGRAQRAKLRQRFLVNTYYLVQYLMNIFYVSQACTVPDTRLDRWRLEDSSFEGPFLP